MKRGGLERQLLLGVVGLFLVPTAIVEAVLVILYRAGAFQDPLTLLLAVLVGLAALMAYLAWVAHTLGRALVGALGTVRRGTELMATVNPDHRIEIRTGDEIEALAEDINRLAGHLREARVDVESRIAIATRDFDAERAKLATILNDLGEGVLVATLDGRVTLANRAAQALLSDGTGLLGRSLYEFGDREGIARFLERLGAGSGTPERLTLTGVRPPHLRASATPFRNGEGRMTGVILALREPGEEGEARERVLAVGPPARSGQPFPGAGLQSGMEADIPGRQRSELYDFSLFTEAEDQTSEGAFSCDFSTLTFVVLDVETTGLSPEAGDRVVSLAGVRIREGVVRTGETFDTLIQPGCPIPPASTKFHGITDNLVASAPAIDAVLPAFARFAEGAVLVGHEVRFDFAFLTREARRLGLEPLALTHPVLDTQLLSRLVHGPGLEHSLDAVARRLGVALIGRHSALGDALITAEVLIRLLGLLDRRGIRTLGQAVAALRAARLGT